MKTISAMVLFALMVFGGQAMAQGNCPNGKVPASCTDGQIRCCMPAGRVDCGNGTNNISEQYCQLARQQGGGSGSGTGGQGRGPVPQGCDPATWHSQGACSMR